MGDKKGPDWVGGRPYCFLVLFCATWSERENVVCVFLDLSYISQWSASRIIGRLRQILQVVSKMARRVIESHHGHLLIMIKSQRYVLFLNGNSQMEDGKSTLPVFGLLAQPTPSSLLLAQTTWQKFPVSP